METWIPPPSSAAPLSRHTTLLHIGAHTVGVSTTLFWVLARLWPRRSWRGVSAKTPPDQHTPHPTFDVAAVCSRSRQRPCCCGSVGGGGVFELEQSRIAALTLARSFWFSFFSRGWLRASRRARDCPGSTFVIPAAPAHVHGTDVVARACEEVCRQRCIWACTALLLDSRRQCCRRGGSGARS